MSAPEREDSPRRLRVLLVEDDPALARSLTLGLQEEGIDVRLARTAAEALASTDFLADVVLLDLGLPDQDGIAVCARLRARSDVPIIIVTARSGSADVVAGLDAGADDYVSKPVVSFELAARVRAAVRRTTSLESGDWLDCGDLQVDARQGTVRLNGRECEVTRTERRLLLELARYCGHSVSREHLLRQVWDYDYFGDTRLLDVHVRRLRLKIEVDPSQPRRLMTVRGLGYRLDP